MTDDDWVQTAMSDDSLVVDLLFRLHRSTNPSSPPLSLDWTVRQRRSRAATVTKKSTPRNSPTTPLSWSGGATSVSGGCEESSRPPPLNRPDSTRSKVHAINGTTTSSKRPRKKKTLAELKEEEVLLLKERRQLKRELETLRENLEKQRTQNASLKRFKVDLGLEPKVAKVEASGTEESTTDQKQKGEYHDPIPPTMPEESVDNNNSSNQLCPSRNSCSRLEEQINDNQEDKFVIPDLNEPLEEDSTREVFSRVS